jgi:hypothetical protein
MILKFHTKKYPNNIWKRRCSMFHFVPSVG